MNPLLEKRIAVLVLLVFSGMVGMASFNSSSDGLAGAVEGSSVFGKISGLLRYATYGFTLFMLAARFKRVVRPALRDPFLWALLGIVVASFLWSDFPSLSRKNGILTLLTSLFGLYLASRFNMKEQVRIVAWAAGISTVFSFFYTLAFPGKGIEQGIHAGAWRGPLLHKNMFARYMVICAPPLLIVALNSRRYRYVVWTAFGIAVALILLTTSKTALVIFLALIVLLPLYRGLQSRNTIIIPLVIILILLAASGAMWLVNHWEQVLHGLGKDTSLTGRTYIWEFVIDKIWERPWLGYGYEGFWQPGGEGEKVIHYIFLTGLTQAHNGYLDITAQLGFIGMAFFMLSLVIAYIRAIAWARLGGKLEDLWPITYITFLFLYNQTETTIVETNSIFWMLYVAVTCSMKYAPRLVSEPFEEERQKGKLMEST